MKNLLTINLFKFTMLALLAMFISGCDWFHNNERRLDSTNPEILLLGDNPQVIEVDSPYVELGASAGDNDDGDITSSVIIDSSAVDTTTVGSYSVTYDVTDSAGNAATTQTRTVNVVADATVPVITLTGDDPQTIEAGDVYIELNATADDNIDGDITANITIDASAVNTDAVGSYSVTYNVFDAAGNAAATQTRTVNVVDTTLPVITLTGDSPQAIELDAVYTELGASASDNIDGDISANIIIDASAVDSSVAGSYSVTYNVSDASGNAAVTRTRTVNVAIAGVSQYYISANNGTDGIELFITNGIADETVMLKDINTAGYSYPYNFFEMGDTTFFTARNGNIGQELWKTDGTEVGTVLVKDIYEGTTSSSADNFANLNGMLLFSARDSINGAELWKSDGTEAGTVLVKDINAGTNNSFPQSFIVMDGVLYFSAIDSTNGRELWKSDGTDVGTVLLKDIETGVTASNPSSFFKINNKIYFIANKFPEEHELWVTDGTEAGTVMVKDISPTSSSYPRYFSEYNGMLFFTAESETGNQELWKSDGTEAGTVLVKEINASGSSDPRHLTVNNGLLFFKANDGDGGLNAELWKSDGTEAGTVMVKDINPTTSSDPNQLISFNNKLYFTANDGAIGHELWTSDGTDAGTVLIKDLNENGHSWPLLKSFCNGNIPLIIADTQLLFSAETDPEGRELWTTDGTTGGTRLLLDIAPGPINGYAGCSD